MLAKKRDGSIYSAFPAPMTTSARSAAKSASVIAPFRTSARGRHVSNIVGMVMACAPPVRRVPYGDSFGFSSMKPGRLSCQSGIPLDLTNRSTASLSSCFQITQPRDAGGLVGGIGFEVYNSYSTPQFGRHTLIQLPMRYDRSSAVSVTMYLFFGTLLSLFLFRGDTESIRQNCSKIQTFIPRL